MSDPFRMPARPRYAEIDQQGVLFNGWYLFWFDEAMTAFMAARGVPMPEVIAAGHDVRLVRTELDWKAPVVEGQDVVVEVSTAALGRTSFTLQFDVVAQDGSLTCRGRTVYVVVSTSSWTPAPIPDDVRAALG